MTHPRLSQLIALGLLLSCAQFVQADAGWFDAGDISLRNDLLLLNDAGVIRLPVNQWPLPRAAVRHAIDRGKPFAAKNQAVIVALERVRARLDSASVKSFTFEPTIALGKGGLLRDFDAFARDRGGLGIHAGVFANDRFEIDLNVSYAIDVSDGREFRTDGSHATVQLGNWLFSAQTLERWWGPGHESSLILSSNARPMPTLLVERAAAREFDSPWLRWLGPWRFNFAISRMEESREDIDAPLFMAWRVAIMPFNSVELGFSRTAQFCGKQLTCDIDSFFNMLAGNDNLGHDARPESEPGNQMAGFDIRWASPVGDLPYAVYGQMIGEDESGYLPAKYLAQFGFEVWHSTAEGGLLQLFAEYADTTCSAISSSGPYYDCAYNQGLFNVEGYRYFDRSIGHTTDRDSRSAAIGGTYTTASSDVWTATVRAARLNRGGNLDVTNPLTAVPADYAAAELGWRSQVLGGRLQLELGIEYLERAGAEGEVQPFGYLRWSRALQP